MSRSKLILLARSLTLLASVGAPSLAIAADLLPPPPPPPAPIPVEVGGGWYLRGDVGVGATEYDSITTALGAPGAVLPTNYGIENGIVGDSYFAGGGVGYQFNSFLRGDVTAEYRGYSNFRFVERFDLPSNGNGQRNGVDVDSGKLRSIVTMANGYFDLGTWYGFTPFVGGGVGGAFHQVSGFIDQGAAGAAGGFGSARTKNSTTLAWAAHAGISYDVTPNFKVDVGYRYMNLGNVKTGSVECVPPTGCSLARYTVNDVVSHDVRIGLRYMLGGVIAAPLPPLAPAYEPMPGPVVRKY